MYGLNVITAPAEEPVGLERAKLHLRVDHTAEDALITAWLVAARELTEAHADRRWVSRAMRLTLADWPCDDDRGPWAWVSEAVPIPVSPVTAVTAVKCYLSDGTLATIDPADYQVWLDHSPPLVAPAPNKTWPTVQTDRLAGVQLEFTAGYGVAAAVPEQAKAAILLCLAYWYENRGDGRDPTAAAGMPGAMGMPAGAKRLLDSLATGAYF